MQVTILKTPIPLGVGDDPFRIAWPRAKILEYKLLTADAEAFNEVYAERANQMAAAEEGPTLTGDPVIDKLERSLWNNMKKGIGVPDGF